MTLTPSVDNSGKYDKTSYSVRLHRPSVVTPELKVGIVHDYLAQAGGAERVVEAIHRVYPNAPIFTSLFIPKATLKYFADKDVRTSYLQRSPFALERWHKFALPLYPAAFESFDLSEFDVIISSSSSFAKGVVTGQNCCHVCYCHTPMRFAWRHHEYMQHSNYPAFMGPMLTNTMSKMRTWDVTSANRVDYFIANSRNVAGRIRKYYRRDSEVIHAPVEAQRFRPVPENEVEDYYLLVSRLIGYKRIDLAVEACSRLGVPLRIIGTGSELDSLKKNAGPTVKFLGRLSDAEVVSQFAHCKAAIFPGEEDFGIMPLECMASGRPIVAYGAGGALETVIHGQTGLFFGDQSVEALMEAIVDLRHLKVDPDFISEHARSFDITVFQRKIQEFISDSVGEHRRLHDLPVSEFNHSRAISPKMVFTRESLELSSNNA